MAEHRENAPKITPGAFIASRELVTIGDVPVSIPDPRQLVHLQFRRFAGCPVCNLHLHSFARRHQELLAASIREVAVFHSTARELCPHASHLPFGVLADPEKRLYAEFGVQASPRALLDPRAWWPIVRAVANVLAGMLSGHAKPPAWSQRGGRLGLPADFLIAPDGRVIACKYGEHVDDHWSVDEVLELAGAASPVEASTSTPQPAS